MTNSTEAIKKTKGPLRTEALVPIAIILGLFSLYGRFFLDSHIRRGLEWTASYIHGAEVNVATVKTSLTGGSLMIGGIEVTDKEAPKQNLIVINEVRFAFLWDALLRMKFVVEEAAVDGISTGTARRTAGWVRPPDPPSAGPGTLEQVQGRVLTQVKSQYSNNVMGDLAQLAGGVDDKAILADIKSQLQSEKKIEEIKGLLKQKEAEWKERLEKLPNKQQFEELSKSAKQLKFNTSDPKTFANDLKELNRLLKDADQKIDAVKAASKSADSDLRAVTNDVKSIDDLIKQDIQDLESRLKIPKLDAASFSKTLFGNMISEKLASYQKYISVAKHYMPAPKSYDKQSGNQEDALIPRARGEGKTYHFPKERSYPLVWVKKVLISSKASQGGFSGDLEGQVLNLTTDQGLIGKPTTATLKGGFPQQGIVGLIATATFDHRTNPARQEIQGRVGQFPVQDLELQKSKDVGLLLKEAKGQTSLSAKFSGPDLNVELNNTFENTQFGVTAESKTIKEILDSSLSSIGPVTVDASIRGSWSKFDLDIDSNLGRQLSAGFSSYFKQKTEALRAKLKEQIDAQVKGQKEKLDADFEKFRKGLTGDLDEKTKELDRLKGEVKSASGGASQNTKQKAKDELKQKGKELLKRFKL